MRLRLSSSRLVFILILLLLFAPTSLGRYYHWQEKESGWDTGLRQNQNVTMYLTGFSMGDGSFSRYGEIFLADVSIKDRTSAANGSIVFNEEMNIESDDTNEVPFEAYKPAGTQDWYIPINESWPVRIDSYRSLDFKGRLINDREDFGNNFEYADSSILYAESLRKDTAVALILKDVLFNAIINDTLNVTLLDEFKGNFSLIMDQRLSFDGQATLKYRHSQDRVPVLEGEDYYWGDFIIRRSINSTTSYNNSTNIDLDWMPCCLNPLDLGGDNLVASAEVRKWLDSR